MKVIETVVLGEFRSSLRYPKKYGFWRLAPSETGKLEPGCIIWVSRKHPVGGWNFSEGIVQRVKGNKVIVRTQHGLSEITGETEIFKKKGRKKLTRR